MKILNFDRGWDFSYSTGNAFLDAKGEAYREIVDLPHEKTSLFSVIKKKKKKKPVPNQK